MNAFNQKGHVKLIKSDSKDIYNVQKMSISNKCLFLFKISSFELSIHQRILKKFITVYTKILRFLCKQKLFDTDNNKNRISNN